MNTGKKAFTLIELLVVIAVIALLIGLLLSGGDAARKKAKIYQAKAMISSLETALAMYHVDFGIYPVSGNQNLVNLLSDISTYGTYPDWQGPYISFKAENLNGIIPSAALKDPWGMDYSYSNAGSSFKITSAGPDKVMSTADDISNE